MVVVFVVVGFVTGISVASGLVVLAISGERNRAYWSLEHRTTVGDGLCRRLRCPIRLFGGCARVMIRCRAATRKPVEGEAAQ
jgi:hypothetical protein